MHQKPNVIGITGYAQVGKSTAADYLRRVYGYDEVCFADALRDLTERIDPLLPEARRYSEAVDQFGYERAKAGVEGFRQFLKDLGNGCREVLGQDVWVRAALKRVRLGNPTVISDCRFLNEAAAIRNHNPHNPGIILRIVRPGFDAESDFEREVDRISPDYVVVNQGSLSDFYNHLAAVMRTMTENSWQQPSLPLAG